MSNDLDMRVMDLTPDPENSKLELMAKLAAQTLNRHYPNHLWMVGWAPGGNLIVKHGAMDSRYGFIIALTKMHSISDFEHKVMLGGGELLERMGLKRGAWTGAMPTHLEGVQGKSRILLPGDMN